MYIIWSLYLGYPQFALIVKHADAVAELNVVVACVGNELVTNGNSMGLNEAKV